MAMAENWSTSFDDSVSNESPDEALIRRAKKRFKLCEEWEAIARIRFIYDYKFANGDAHNKYQWDSELVYNRELQDRPCLTINRVAQHNLMIINDAKQNKSGVKVAPVGQSATFEAAEIMQEIIYHIEYISNADNVYDYAVTYAVQAGIGYWRVEIDYIDDESFDKEIYIRRIKDPLTVYLDPDINEIDGSDARYGFVFEDCPKDLFKEQYPDDADIASSAALGNTTTDMWITQNHVRIAEYFEKEEKKDKLVYFIDPESGPVQGLLSKLDKYHQDLFKEIKKRERDIDFQLRTYQERKLVTNNINWYKIAGNRIIDRKPWIGKYVPIVRVPGTETVIDGILDRKGHTRAMLDPQKIYNWNSSANVEFGALQTKAPWVSAIEAIEGFEEYYKTANTKNHSVLPYKAFDDDGNQLPAPERPQPPQPSPAYTEALQIAQNEMMMVSGQYQSQFGENENAKSGVAINARQRQGDRSTYHFIDNQAIAIRFTGKILLDLIPKVYDTQRVKQIEAKDGDILQVTIDPDADIAYQNVTDMQNPMWDKEMQVKQIIFNPSIGHYDLQADAGPSFATRRQEAFNALSQIAAQNPQFMMVAGDILWKVADFPEAQVLAQRWRKIIAPNITGDAPDPQTEQAMHAAADKIQQQLMVIAEQSKKLEDKSKEYDLKMGDLELRMQDHKLQQEERKREQARLDYDARTKRLTALGNFGPNDSPPPGYKKAEKVVNELLEDMTEDEENLEHIEDSVEGIKGSRKIGDDHYVQRNGQWYKINEKKFHPTDIGAIQGSDGAHYIPDPSREGKYMQVMHE